MLQIIVHLSTLVVGESKQKRMYDFDNCTTNVKFPCLDKIITIIVKILKIFLHLFNLVVGKPKQKSMYGFCYNQVTFPHSDKTLK